MRDPSGSAVRSDARVHRAGRIYERPGTYTIVVSHPGYDQWQQAGVVVERDECHVITKHVTARLTPA